MPDIPTINAKNALAEISASGLSKAKKLLLSSLVTQARSFEYTFPESQQPLLILDVTHFLNHRVNTQLINAIGEELADELTPFSPEIILTAPSSGNIPAIVTGLYLDNMPDIIYAPKGQPVTIADAYTSTSRSYTYGKTVDLSVAKDCLPPDTRVAICDDFLDTGRTALDLAQIVEKAGAVVEAFFFVIEKPYRGREIIKSAGYTDAQIISLVSIEAMAEGKLKFPGFSSWFELSRR